MNFFLKIIQFNRSIDISMNLVCTLTILFFFQIYNYTYTFLSSYNTYLPLFTSFRSRLSASLQSFRSIQMISSYLRLLQILRSRIIGFAAIVSVESNNNMNIYVYNKTKSIKVCGFTLSCFFLR